MSVDAEPLLAERYELGPVIGRGGAGEVRRAWDRRLARDVAVKLLLPELAADPVVRSRFEDEARVAAGLVHPSIVTVLDHGEHEGRPFLVMECLPGRTLADEIRERGALPPDEVRRVGAEVAAALDAAHAVGVVHRDVKPGNVLLTSEGRAKLADFGIAKSTEGLDHTLTGQVIGTPAYLAPERFDSAPATPAADIYALGIVLYEALTGQKPFNGPTPLAVLDAIRRQPPPPLRTVRPDVEPRFASAIDRALAKDPACRPPSAAALVAGDDADATAAISPAATVAFDATSALPAAAVPRSEEPTATFAASPGPAVPRRVPRRGAVALGRPLLVLLGVLLLAGLAWAATHVASGGDGGTTATTVASVPATTAGAEAPTDAPTGPATTAAVAVAPDPSDLGGNGIGENGGGGKGGDKGKGGGKGKG